MINKQQWLQDNGFNKKEETYCITGNTYQIKDLLKAQQCKYSPLLKWHTPIRIDIPDIYKQIKIIFSQIYDWDTQLQKPLLHKDAETLLHRLLYPAAAQDYQFLGDIGQRFYNISAILKEKNNFISRFGQFTYIYTFETDNNRLIWFTTKDINIDINIKVLLTATVVQHQNYKGYNTTVINRCIIKKESDS